MVRDEEVARDEEARAEGAVGGLDLDGLGGFSAADIDEARVVARALRARPAQVVAVSEEARKALELRNKLAGLLPADAG